MHYDILDKINVFIKICMLTNKNSNYYKKVYYILYLCYIIKNIFVYNMDIIFFQLEIIIYFISYKGISPWDGHFLEF